ncbi:hypothetical protein V9T40_004592 [Parthenolecanium corni]|uniref:Uncharacterized protein n=1 Tax=Parthenolecanium corni TaxID=536013 RepID=A0AAN9U252_9HEMI
MASSFIRVLLLCTTPAIIPSSSSAQYIGDVFGYNSAHQFVDVGLKFLEEPRDAIVAINQTVELHCRARSSLNETVSIDWFHNGKKIEDSSRMRVNNEVLKITPRKKKPSEAGVYQCTANITRGLSPAVLISRLARVEIARLSSVSNLNRVIISSVGRSIRLSCEFTSVPAANVTWTFQNQSLQLSNARYVVSIPGVLYIADVKSSDSGEYKCLVFNPCRSKPKASSSSHVKIVSSASKIEVGKGFSPHESFVKNISVVSGETLTLECSAPDGENRFVIWIFSPSFTEGGEEERIISKSKYFNILKKSNVSSVDAGLYSCAFIGDDSVIRKITEFNVTIVVPPQFTVNPKSQNVTLAFRVNFECKADGYPPPSIKWYRNGVPVQTNARVVIHSDGLKLLFASTQDFGMYQCIASNDYGTVSSSARLYMVDIANPTSPANLSCFDANSTALYLRWEQPNDRNHQPLVAFRIGNNGSAPDMPYVYVVAYHEADDQHPQEHIQPATSNSLVVDSLKPDTKYVLSVLSFQGKSGSDPSKSVVCTTSREDMTPSTSESVSCSSVECNSVSEFPITSAKMSYLKSQSVNNSAVLGNFINGRDVSINQPAPLLSGSSSGYANGFIQGYEFGNRRMFYDLESNTLREENDRLLNNSNLPSEDMRLTIPDDQDHEGGDSGYCERNQSLSPHSGYLEDDHRLRKFMDVVVDDGFYESEFQTLNKTTNSHGCELKR